MIRLEYWVSVALDGATLYATTAETEGDLLVGGVRQRFRPTLRVGEISQAFAAFDSASPSPPATCRVTLVNQDGWLNEFLGFGAHARTWDNRIVTIKYRQSDATILSSFESLAMEMTGRVSRGTLRHTRDDVSFDVYDIRYGHNRPVLSAAFDDGTYPNAHDDAKGRYIPLVFGDFTQGILPAQIGGVSPGRLPAFCTDTAATAYPFKAANHAISDMAVFWFDASAGTVVQLGGGDYTATTGGFTLSALQSAATDIASDRYTVNCKGRSAVRLVSGGSGVLESAADIMADLLVTFGGAVYGTDFDGIGWSAAHTTGDQHPNRRWIGEQTTVMEAVSQIAFENSYLFFTNPERYKLIFNLPSRTVVADVRDVDPLVDSVESVYDPDSSYVNQIYVYFDPDVSGGDGAERRGNVRIDNATAQTEYGAVVSGEFDFWWLWNKENVSLQSERKLFVLSSRMHYVDFDLAANDPNSPFWRLTLSDVIRLSHWQYAAAPLQVWSIVRDAQTGKIALRTLAVQDVFQVWQWSGIANGADVTYPMRWNDAAVTKSPAGRWF